MCTTPIDFIIPQIAAERKCLAPAGKQYGIVDRRTGEVLHQCGRDLSLAEEVLNYVINSFKITLINSEEERG